jgi:hypothetical protein
MLEIENRKAQFFTYHDGGFIVNHYNLGYSEYITLEGSKTKIIENSSACHNLTKIVNSGICLGGQDNWKAEQECCSTLHIYFTFMKFHSIKITTISSRNNNIEVRRSHENRK